MVDVAGAANSVCSLPPCGGGLGWGVAAGAYARGYPPPCPSPARGEGTLRRQLSSRLVSLRGVFASLALAVAVQASSAAAQEPFYAGKTVTLVVGYSAGGGYDIYARMLARHYGRHIPGNPNVIVQNMPGAASMTSVRYLDATAPKDGTVITTFDPGLITQVLTADKPVVNFANFQWIGTLLRDIRICYAWSATGIKTFGDMMKRKEFMIGTTAKGSNAYVNGAILRNVFKAPVRQIAGYPGSNEQRLALERGELEGNCGSWTAMPQEWLVNTKINENARKIRGKKINARLPTLLQDGGLTSRTAPEAVRPF